MGGRGAASGASKSGKKYGTEYKTVYKSGNIKFVVANNGSNTAPMETRTQQRIYVTIDKYTNQPKFISYYDKNNKRVKQIDLDKSHFINGKRVVPHTHHGYEHNENDDSQGAAHLTQKEQKMVDKVKNLWYNYNNGKA